MVINGVNCGNIIQNFYGGCGGGSGYGYWGFMSFHEIIL